MLLSFYWPCDLLHFFASLPLQSTPERKRRNFWYLCILGFLLIINCKEFNLKCVITCNASAHLLCLWSQMLLSPNRSMPQPKARKWIHACKNIFFKIPLVSDFSESDFSDLYLDDSENLGCQILSSFDFPIIWRALW